MGLGVAELNIVVVLVIDEVAKTLSKNTKGLELRK